MSRDEPHAYTPPSHATATAGPAAPGGADRRWPARYAVILAWLRPAATTGRTAHVTLLRAYGIHVLGLLLLAFVAELLASPWGSIYSHGPARLLDALIGIALKLARALRDDPRRFFLGMSAAGLVAELMTFALVFGVMPFGAKHERLRDSIRHALRRTWLHTAHVAVVVFLAGAATNEMSRYRMAWYDSLDRRFMELHPAPDDARDATDPAYRAAQQEYWRMRSAFYAAQAKPWYVSHQGDIEIACIVAAITWVLWALLRGVSAPRAVRAPPPAPPWCRWCGYDLTGSAAGGRCSECGRLVQDSLGESADPGAPWEHRRVLGWWRAYWQTTLAGVRRPAQLARQLRLGAASAAHLRFASLQFIVCAGIVGSAYAVYMASQAVSVDRWTSGWIRETCSVAIISGVSTFLILLALSSVVASLAAAAERIRTGRNLLGGIVQAASYASGFLVVWTFVSAGILLIGHVQFHDFRILGDLLGVNDMWLAVGTWFLLLVLGGAGYVSCVAAAIPGLRYARR